MQFIQQLQERFDQKVIQDPQNAQGHKNMRHFFFYRISIYILRNGCLIENQAHIKSQYQS